MSDKNVIEENNKLNLQRLFISRIKNNPNHLTIKNFEMLQQVTSNEISEVSEPTVDQTSIKKEKLRLKSLAKRGIKKILIIFFYFPANFIRRFMTKNLQVEILQHHQNLQNQSLHLIQTHQIEFQNRIIELFNNLQNEILNIKHENLDLIGKLNLKVDTHKSDIIQLLSQLNHHQQYLDLISKLHLKVDIQNSDIIQLLTQLDHRQMSKTAEIITLIASFYLQADANLTKNNKELNEIAQKVVNLHRKADYQCTHIDKIENCLARYRNYIVLEEKNSILIKTPMGYLFCSLDDIPTCICFINSSDLEQGTGLFIQKFLKQETIYIDIGANYGIHVLAAYQAMQGQGKIIAFEPFPRTAQLLDQSINLNQHFGSKKIIELHQKAVSKESGLTQLFLGKVSGLHSLYPLGEMSKQDNETVNVEKVRLDDVVDSEIHIDLIKIDVEGAELDVITGATRTIKNNPNVALIIEFCPSHIARSSHTIEEWFSVFHQLGLIFKAINHLDGSLEDWNIDQLKQIESVNLLFARPTSTVWDKV